ncbi:MAG TPA: hypothetical protein VMR81_03785 [Patescibacteria group bacterium]|nr:hypothetical protein [Patescibacteria group bacterium]
MIESKREIIEHPKPLTVGVVEYKNEIHGAWMGYDPQHWVFGAAETRYYDGGHHANALNVNYFGGTYLLTTSQGETDNILQRITKARENRSPVILRYLDANTREMYEALVLAAAPFNGLTDGNGLTVWLKLIPRDDDGKDNIPRPRPF